jgi:hypothetical protein
MIQSTFSWPKLVFWVKIFWPETIINSDGDTWNYDISPEYIYHCGEDIDIESKEVIEFK